MKLGLKNGRIQMTKHERIKFEELSMDWLHKLQMYANDFIKQNQNNQSIVEESDDNLENVWKNYQVSDTDIVAIYLTSNNVIIQTAVSVKKSELHNLFSVFCAILFFFCVCKKTKKQFILKKKKTKHRAEQCLQ